MNTNVPTYLDHNATTPFLPEVVDAMPPFLREQVGNPPSGQVYGRRAKDTLVRARHQVAALLRCDVSAAAGDTCRVRARAALRAAGGEQ
jgi:cysteine desulfurase